MCRITGEDIAEVARWHGKAHGPCWSPNLQRRPEVIDDLRDDPGPVDGIDGAQVHAVTEGQVVEQRLHRVLTIVKGALKGDGVHIRRGHRGHLSALYVGDAAVRIQDEDVDVVAVAARLDGGRACIARRRTGDADAFAARRQNVIKQRAQKLHCHVLEGEGRAVEELHHPFAVTQFRKWRDLLRIEMSVGIVDDAFQIGVGDGAANKWLDHPEG